MDCIVYLLYHSRYPPQIGSRHDHNHLSPMPQTERFTARRVLPRRTISDNAKTFKTTAKFIKAILGQKEAKDYLSLVSQSGVVIQSQESPLVGWDL